MGKSSKDKRDAYYRLAKEQNWRARSAFKLIQLDEQFDLFSYNNPSECTRVVDLCAAPGSWSQVLSRILIKGESFGRRAWLEKRERIQRQQQQRQEPPAHGLDKLSLNTSDENNNEEYEDHNPLLQPRENVKIVAVDLQPMSPLPGIIQLIADITHPTTVPRLLSALSPNYDPQDPSSTPPQVDLLISDGAPDVTGLHTLDIYIQSSLLHSALSLAIKVLRPGGKFVAKIFRAKNVDLIYAQLKLVFETVSIAKPRASRASSLEAFVVGEGFRPPKDMTDEELEAMFGTGIAMVEPDLDGVEGEVESRQTRTTRPDGVVEIHFDDEERDNKRSWIAPFLACGDLSAWDSDAIYRLPEGHISLDPVQPPTAPPYKEAIERRRIEGGKYGKTKTQSKNTGGNDKVL